MRFFTENKVIVEDFANNPILTIENPLNPHQTTPLTGFNAKRLNMLLAVLEKRAGFRLSAKDVFLNITGGITVDDPAIDLAVVAAILSSNEDVAIPKDYCFAAEVELSGEIRPVQRVEQRILEAEKYGNKHKVSI